MRIPGHSKAKKENLTLGDCESETLTPGDYESVGVLRGMNRRGGVIFFPPRRKHVLLLDDIPPSLIMGWEHYLDHATIVHHKTTLLQPSV